MLCHSTSHGITYAVATLGTAINIKHLQKCLRFSDDIVFCFDGDNAGRKAAWKGLTLAMPALRDGINLKFLFLPDGEDPDSLVKKIGKAAFEALLEKATPLQTVFFDELKKQHPGNSAADKAALAKEAKKQISLMPQGIYQELLYDELARLIGVSRDELAHTQIARRRSTPPATEIITPNKSASKLTLHCISLLLQEPKLAKKSGDTLFLHDATDSMDVLLLKLLHIFKEHPELPVGQLLIHWDNPTEQALIARLAAKELAFPREGYEHEFLDTLKVLSQQNLKRRINLLINKAKKSTLDQDEKKLLAELLTHRE